MDYFKNCFARGKVHRALGNTVEEKAQNWRDCSSHAAIFPTAIITVILIIIMFGMAITKDKLVILAFIIPIMLLSYGIYKSLKYSQIIEADRFEELWKMERKLSPNLSVAQFIIEVEIRVQQKRARNPAPHQHTWNQAETHFKDNKN